MKILVTGAKGQLGNDCLLELEKRGYEFLGVDKDDMDITDPDMVNTVLSKYQPDGVIHCAAWTAVDDAEDEDKQGLVHSINVTGTKNVADACKSCGCKMLYLSTDYVFSGEGSEPWSADCTDYAPISVYGKSKLDGEMAVVDTLDEFFIVRIAWVFGMAGNNFIQTMLNVGQRFPELKVVNDQIGTPTYTVDLARLLVDIISTDGYGYYHATNEGEYISWYDFACEIFKQATDMGYEQYANDRLSVLPVTTEEYGMSKAKRPKNSRLDRSKLVCEGFTPLPNWKDAVRRYLSNLEKEGLLTHGND